MTQSTPNLPWPDSGRLAAIDYGTVRIGIAICDPSRRWVNPHETLNRCAEHLESEFFNRLVREESIVGWVVGLPIHCDGNESQKSSEARDFAVWLSKITSLPIKFCDERFSSKQADAMMRPAELTKKKKKKQLDSVAASVILQSFLELTEQRQNSLKHSEFNESLD